MLPRALISGRRVANLLPNGGPVGGPVETFDPHHHGAILIEIESVEDDQAVAASRGEVGGAPAGAAPAGVALKENGATAVHHRGALFIGERSVGAGRAADRFLVVIGGDVLVAAVIDGDEEVVVVSVMNERCAFDGVVRDAGPGGQVVAGRVRSEQHAGGGIDLPLLDTGPVAAVGHPYAAIGIDENVGVDGVGVVPLIGREDFALVDPFIGRIGGVEGGV